MNPPIHPKLLAFAEAVAAAERAAIPHQQSQVFGESSAFMVAHRTRAAWVAAKCPIYDIAPRTCWECHHANEVLCALLEDDGGGDSDIEAWCEGAIVDDGSAMPLRDAPPCPGFEERK